MTNKRLAELERFSDSQQFSEWLVSGTKKMCGIVDGTDDAFSPIADLIGLSREHTWIEDLARIYPMLTKDICSRFSDGLNEALISFVKELSNDNWEVAVVLVDLIRQIDPYPRMKGLTVLTNHLVKAFSQKKSTSDNDTLYKSKRTGKSNFKTIFSSQVPTLSEGAIKKLALNVLMAIFESRPSEITEAQEAAKQLKNLIFELYPDIINNIPDRMVQGFEKLQLPLDIPIAARVSNSIYGRNQNGIPRVARS